MAEVVEPYLKPIDDQGSIMTKPEKKKAVLYAREVPEPGPDPERFIYLLDKWDGLEKALGADADVLVVAFPEVLGDTYTELVINLGRIAESGKSLGITKGSPWLLKGGEIEL